MSGLLPYFNYLLPSDGIQSVFLALVIFLSVGTALWVKLSTRPKKGKPSCWEIRWTNNTPTNTADDLKVEHGSIHELCDAVALPAEKLAEVLPSMLLIVGLMGTFLGVGVALNEAANVLKNSERPPMEMLQEMVSMLDGLGALFKSSIYGIIGFFAFTLWKNKWGTSEKRFKWCVEKCNKELESKKSEAKKFQEIQEKNTNRIVKELQNVNESIGASIADCIQKSLQSALVNGFESVNQILNDMNSALCTTLENTIVERFKSLEKEMKSQVKETKSVVQHLEGIANQYETQVTAMDTLSSTMKEQFTYVAKSATSMGTAADALAKSVNEFKPAVTSTLENIRQEFVSSITQGSKVMENAGVSIRDAVNEMSKKSKESQDKLDNTLTDFNKRINATLSDIKQTTLAMEEQGNSYVQTMKELSEQIGDKLGSISRANLTIKSGMGKLPEDLSQSIGSTLQSVKNTIESSITTSTEKVVKTLEGGFGHISKQRVVEAKAIES